MKTTKLMLTSKAKSGSAKRSKGVVADLAKQLTAPSAPGERSNTEITSAIIDQLTAPSAPAPAPVSLLDSGNPNLTSRRITLRMDEIVSYRYANNQRKPDQSGGAKYYVQGGAERVDPLNPQRSRFEVAVEYPYTDLYKAKLKLAELRATLTAPATTEVQKIA